MVVSKVIAFTCRLVPTSTGTSGVNISTCCDMSRHATQNAVFVTEPEYGWSYIL